MNSIVYWGLALNTSTLVGDPYVNVVIMGLLEIPACCVNMLLLQKLYRRWCISGAMFIAGVSLMTMQLVPSGIYMVIFILRIFIGL